MSPLVVRNWAAWAPGIETEGDWQGWVRAPTQLGAEGIPNVGFLPAMLRRRCDGLSRLMLFTAQHCCEESERDQVTSVFASRYGPVNTTLSMLADLAQDEPVSPTRFSHSVHNAQAGLFAIWTGNQQASASVSARGDTFALGFLEALCILHRYPDRSVLFVCGDEALGAPLAELANPKFGPHSLALLLSRTGPGQPLSFRPGAPAPADAARGWPDGVEFLRWMLSADPSLHLAGHRNSWVWTRG